MQNLVRADWAECPHCRLPFAGNGLCPRPHLAMQPVEAREAWRVQRVAAEGRPLSREFIVPTA